MSYQHYHATIFLKLLALGEEFENAQSALRHCGYSLSCTTKLITLLIRWVLFACFIYLFTFLFTHFFFFSYCLFIILISSDNFVNLWCSQALEATIYRLWKVAAHKNFLTNFRRVYIWRNYFTVKLLVHFLCSYFLFILLISSSDIFVNL